MFKFKFQVNSQRPLISIVVIDEADVSVRIEHLASNEVLVHLLDGLGLAFHQHVVYIKL